MRCNTSKKRSAVHANDSFMLASPTRVQACARDANTGRRPQNHKSTTTIGTTTSKTTREATATKEDLKRGEPSRTPMRRIHKDQWQAQNQSHSYATPTCKSCGEELKHAEASKRSGNCNKCHHRSDDTPQTSSSAKPATTGSSRGGGNGGKGVTQVCIKCSNALSEEEHYKGRKLCDPCSAHYYPQLGGLHRGDKEDSYWPGDSHHRGNTAPRKGQTGSK